MTSFTDGRGNTSHYDYDGDGNLVSYTDVLGNVTEYAYDGKGQPAHRNGRQWQHDPVCL